MVIDEGFVEFKFVRTHDNLSDGMTKNVTSDILTRHNMHHEMKRDDIDVDPDVTKFCTRGHNKTLTLRRTTEVVR